jgi:cytoskeletal protein CcmA (bactofilin family)
MRAQKLQPLELQPALPPALRDARRIGTLDQREPPATTHASIFGADVTVTGNIEASVDLHIEGQVIGDVHCARLVVAEGSYVNGRIFAARAKVSGTVDGGVEAKDLAVEASGRLTGDIAYQRLRISNGGVIEGKVSHLVAK